MEVVSISTFFKVTSVQVLVTPGTPCAVTLSCAYTFEGVASEVTKSYTWVAFCKNNEPVAKMKYCTVSPGIMSLGSRRVMSVIWIPSASNDSPKSPSKDLRGGSYILYKSFTADMSKHFAYTRTSSIEPSK